MGHKILYIERPVNPIFYPAIGGLYNWYAAADARYITSSDDWVVPTQSDYEDLLDPLGTRSSNTWIGAGGKLKEIGTTYWGVGGTNETGFNSRGAGERNTSGIFLNITVDNYLRTKTVYSATTSVVFNTYSTNQNAGWFASQHTRGYSVRLLYTGAGTPTTYTGNDGKIYRVVTIGTQTWLADNLSETRFRNGDIIPWYGADPANYFTNAEWAALTTAGCCAYNNDKTNVAAGFDFPA